MRTLEKGKKKREKRRDRRPRDEKVMNTGYRGMWNEV